MRGVLATVIAAVSLAAVSVAPAGAAETHVPDGTLAVGGNPGQLAIHEATGDIYVLNGIGSKTIVRFDSNGDPKNFPLLGTNVIDGVGGADDNKRGYFAGDQFAIDNSGGVNDGAIYVSIPFAKEADVYLPSGKYAGRITGTSDDFLPFQGGDTCGIAASGDGSVYLTHQYRGEFPRRGFIDKFRPGLWVPDSNPAQDWPVKSTMRQLDENTCHIAVDSKALFVTTANSFAQLAPLKRYPLSVLNISDPPSTTVTETAQGAYVDSSNDDLYVNELSRVSRYDSSGELLESFGGGEVAPFVGGVAVDRDTGTAYVSNLATGALHVYDLATTPDVTDLSVAANPTSAELTAQVGTAGAGEVTSCEVEYGTGDSYGSSVPCDPAAPYTGDEEIEVTIPSLTLDTTYHYRVVAVNAGGETRTVDRTFTTRAIRNLEATAPTAVTRDSATLNGTFTGAGEATSYHFEWGTTPGLGNETSDEDAGSGSGPQAISADIEGLSTYTPYYYRVVATSTAGTTASETRRFVTAAPQLPAVSGSGASAITSTGATLGASINPGFGSTVYLFEYGLTPEFGSQTRTSESIGNDGDSHPVEASLAGLTPGSTYYFRVVAINLSGTTNGPTLTFDTPAAPTVGPASATVVGESTATLSASVAGGFLPTTYRFEYGPTPAYGMSTPAATLAAADNFQHPVSAPVAGLQPGTTYYFRLVAANQIGSVGGAASSFSTAPQAAVAPPEKKPKKCRKGQVKRKGKCVKKGKKGKSKRRAAGRGKGRSA